MKSNKNMGWRFRLVPLSTFYGPFFGIEITVKRWHIVLTIYWEVVGERSSFSSIFGDINPDVPRFVSQQVCTHNCVVSPFGNLSNGAFCQISPIDVICPFLWIAIIHWQETTLRWRQTKRHAAYLQKRCPFEDAFGTAVHLMQKKQSVIGQMAKCAQLNN